MKVFIFIYLLTFIYLERERESMSGEGAEREGDRGSKVGSVLTADCLMWGLNLRTVRS